MMLYDCIANTNKESGERIAKLSTRQLEDETLRLFLFQWRFSRACKTRSILRAMPEVPL